MLALAHHVPDIAEHKEIAGHRARHARDVVCGAGEKPAGKAFGEMRRRIGLGDGIAHPARQLVADGYVFLPGEIDKARRKIGIARGQRALDICRDS